MSAPVTAPVIAPASAPSSTGRLIRFGLLALLSAGLLYLVFNVYMVGETLLAVTLLVLAGLALWTYTSSSTTALRYLFPGVAAALVFVVFPMVYTIAIGFTNYSSRNLLDYERSRQFMLEESVREEGPGYTFSLHPDLKQYRLRLQSQDDDTVAFVSSPLALKKQTPLKIDMEREPAERVVLGEPMPFKDIIAQQNDLKLLTLHLPDGKELRMTSLREFAPVKPAYKGNPDGTLTHTVDGSTLKPNFKTGFFENEAGEQKQPGFQVTIGFDHYKRIFTDSKFSEPFLRIFIWTVMFSGLSVLFAAGLGMFLAVLLNWESLQFKGVYRLLLFLPYAVPGFISILIFKGLFNQNLGEINLILDGLFGIRPKWFADPLLAKVMLLIVNTWLGFPYMMVVCMGLIKSIPSDLYEASAVVGASPVTNFFSITAPLILKPLTPLLISAFAFNFNNFVLIALLTNGRPDYLNIDVPAGTTDILVSYTMRIAFQDSGQQFGLASAISTVIFFIVAAITMLQMRFTRMQDDKR
jgi:maltose/maltodextrin transport system permease protein